MDLRGNIRHLLKGGNSTAIPWTEGQKPGKTSVVADSMLYSVTCILASSVFIKLCDGLLPNQLILVDVSKTFWKTNKQRNKVKNSQVYG
jgi:hypothetical protein